MNSKELRRKVARLESKFDHLETEMDELNAALVQSGFPEGIESLREVAKTLLEEE